MPRRSHQTMYISLSRGLPTSYMSDVLTVRQGELLQDVWSPHRQGLPHGRLDVPAGLPRLDQVEAGRGTRRETEYVTAAFFLPR